MAIDRVEAARIARLARLDLEPGEVDALARQLDSVLDYVARLDELDLNADDAQPGATVAATELRGDEPRPGLGAEAALGGAPDAASGFFRVPRSFPE